MQYIKHLFFLKGRISDDSWYTSWRCSLNGNEASLGKCWLELLGNKTFPCSPIQGHGWLQGRETNLKTGVPNIPSKDKVLGKKFQIWLDLWASDWVEAENIMPFPWTSRERCFYLISYFIVLVPIFCQRTMKKSNSRRIWHDVPVNIGAKHRRLTVWKEGPCPRMALGPSVLCRMQPAQPCMAALDLHSPSEVPCFSWIRNLYQPGALSTPPPVLLHIHLSSVCLDITSLSCGLD